MNEDFCQQKLCRNFYAKHLIFSVPKRKFRHSFNYSNFLGFTYWKGSSKWECKPNNKSKRRLYENCRKELIRKKCVAQTNAKTFTRINQIVIGWINYFRIGKMKGFIDEFGQWLRHKIRVILFKQWKKPKRIYINLQRLSVNKNA